MLTLPPRLLLITHTPNLTTIDRCGTAMLPIPIHLRIHRVPLIRAQRLSIRILFRQRIHHHRHTLLTDISTTTQEQLAINGVEPRRLRARDVEHEFLACDAGVVGGRVEAAEDGALAEGLARLVEGGLDDGVVCGIEVEG